MANTISKDTVAQQATTSLLLKNGLSNQTSSNQSSSTVNGLSAKASAKSSGTTSSSRNEDVVSLSKEALTLLEQEKKSKEAQQSSDYGFTLSKKQEAAIGKILKAHKTEQITEANWNKILGELKSAKMGVDKLTAQERFRSFNPAQVFLRALSGKQSSTTASGEAGATAQAKRSQFLKQVMADWQTLKQSG